MKEKSDYVMLPPKNGSQPSFIQRLSRRALLATVLVVVAAVSWWGGSRSGQDHNEGDVKQVSTSVPGPVAASQLTGSETALASSEEDAGGATLPAAGGEESSSAAGVERETSVDFDGFGGIALVTDPVGVHVKIRDLNGGASQEGTTPLTLTDLAAGFYEVTLSRLGYRTERATFEVVPNRIREIETIQLERSRGTLDIRSTQAVRYELFAKTGNGSDEKYELIASGNAPGEIPNLPVNVYRLALTRSGWPTISRDVTVAEGMTTEVEQDFPEGVLVITSNPEGAEVWVKGQHQEVAVRAGVTPARIEKLPAGAYEVVLRHSAGSDQRLLLQVEADAVTAGHGGWSHQKVLITSDPPGATVYEGAKRLKGEDSFVTPFITNLLEGRHELRAVRPGLKDVPLTFHVIPGTESEAHFAFQYGSLQVTSDPAEAEVFQNGRALGVTPLLVTHIAPGKHAFELRKERYNSREISGLVRSGHRLDLSTQLQYNPVPTPGSDFTNGVGQRMIWVEALRCWVGATEIPQRIYEPILRENPSQFVGPELPVNNVTWMEAVRFCEQLTIAERGTGFIPDGYRYHIPTDEQWSSFAAGTPLAQSITSKLGQRETPEPVGSLARNRFGLHDTRGNVWEWCRDWYTLDVFNREQQENATAKSERVGTRFKILRGGSWNRAQDANLALGYRLLADPNMHHNYETGFRVVLEKF